MLLGRVYVNYPSGSTLPSRDAKIPEFGFAIQVEDP